VKNEARQALALGSLGQVDTWDTCGDHGRPRTTFVTLLCPEEATVLGKWRGYRVKKRLLGGRWFSFCAYMLALFCSCYSYVILIRVSSSQLCYLYM
jgi:hypothetical protein